MKIKSLFVFLALLLFIAQGGFAQNLDVEFSSFKEVGSGIFLEWKMPDGNTATQCILERSAHGATFKTLEIFDHIQKSSSNYSSFTYFDNQMGLEKASYRLKFIESDFSSFYSQEVSITKKSINTYRIVEQELMSHGMLRVTIESIEKGNLEFSLFDAEKEKVMKEKWKVDLGLNDYFINLDYFLDGEYSGVLKKEKEYQTLTFNKNTKGNGVAMKE